jgi:hypothetical protein
MSMSPKIYGAAAGVLVVIAAVIIATGRHTHATKAQGQSPTVLAGTSTGAPAGSSSPAQISATSTGVGTGSAAPSPSRTSYGQMPTVPAVTAKPPNTSPATRPVRVRAADKAALAWGQAMWINNSALSSSYTGWLKRTAPLQTSALTAADAKLYGNPGSFGNWPAFIANRCHNVVPDAAVHYPDDQNAPGSPYPATATSQWTYIAGTVNTLCQTGGNMTDYTSTYLLHLQLHGTKWLVAAWTTI